MFKTFATSSRHMKILATLARMSCERSLTKTVARNSDAGEMLRTKDFSSYLTHIN